MLACSTDRLDPKQYCLLTWIKYLQAYMRTVHQSTWMVMGNKYYTHNVRRTLHRGRPRIALVLTSLDYPPFTLNRS